MSRRPSLQVVDGLASGFVRHLEHARLPVITDGPAPKTPDDGNFEALDYAKLVGLLAVGVGGGFAQQALGVLSWVPASAQGLALWISVSWYIAPLALAKGKQLEVLEPYLALFEGLLPSAAHFLAGFSMIAVGVHRAPEYVGEFLYNVAMAIMMSSVLSAGRWLVECLYSTRLLKLRCGPRVLDNAWHRAVVERFRECVERGPEAALDPSPVLPQFRGLWEFDFHCAELIRLNAADAHSKKDQDEDYDAAEGAELFNQIIELKEAQSATIEESPTSASYRTLSAEMLLSLLPKEDAQNAWVWLWGDGGDGTGEWLWNDCADGPGVDESTFVNRISQAKAETEKLVSNICEYNSIFALFRTVVGVAHGGAMICMLLSLFWPGAMATLWWISSSVIVAVSFTFGPLIRDACESLALILVIRPFDVGDRVVIAGNRMRVMEIDMLTTTFMNGHNELVWIRNSQIFAEKGGVRNLSRSKNEECGVELDLLAEDSTQQNIEALSAAVKKFCEAWPDKWVANDCGQATALASPAGCTVAATMSVSGAATVRWRFRATHRENLHNALSLAMDTSRLLTLLVDVCNKLGIRFCRPPLQTFGQSD